MPDAEPMPVPAERSFAVGGSVLLRARGIVKRFDGQRVLRGVDLELRKGDVVLLRGANGAGKTTLLNVLCGALTPDEGSIEYGGSEGPCVFPRRGWRSANPFTKFAPEFAARRGIGRVWQDVRLFGTLTLRENLAVAAPNPLGERPLFALFRPRAVGRREGEIARDAKAILARLGLEGREDSSADRISLGQSKRVGLARAISGEAKALFLDEPLAGLDERGVREVLGMLADLVRDRGVALLIVEHVFNQSRVRDLATAEWVMEDGRLRVTHVEPGRTRPNGASQHPEWLAALALPGAAFVDEALPRGACLTRVSTPSSEPSPVLLKIEGLIVKRGARTVVGLDDEGRETGLSLELRVGELALLQAPNGWGKSTLFAAITGEVRPHAGEIWFDGRRIDGASSWARARLGVRALPSEQMVYPDLRVSEALALAGKRATDYAPGLKDRLCSSLSGGERQKLAMASFDPGSLNLYDEPFAALDDAGLADAIRRLRPRPDATDLILVPTSQS